MGGSSVVLVLRFAIVTLLCVKRVIGIDHHLIEIVTKSSLAYSPPQRPISTTASHGSVSSRTS
jgi:uncharacterized membrane protein YcfT